MSFWVQSESSTLLQCCPTIGPKQVLLGIVSRTNTPEEMVAHEDVLRNINTSRLKFLTQECYRKVSSLTVRLASYRHTEAEWAGQREAGSALNGRVRDEGDWSVLRAVGAVRALA